MYVIWCAVLSVGLLKLLWVWYPQDYSQQRPSQELVAKDLHGTEWKFRHIYRGSTAEQMHSGFYYYLVLLAETSSFSLLAFVPGSVLMLRLKQRA